MAAIVDKYWPERKPPLESGLVEATLRQAAVAINCSGKRNKAPWKEMLFYKVARTEI